MPLYPWLPILAVVILALGVAVWLFRRSGRRATPLAQAKQRFHVQRERLEAKFIQLAAAHATPDAPQWTDCTFDDDVAYVRSRTTGELSAFVAVTIASENVSGAAANTSDAVGNLQAGTAVFRFDLDHWETDGRAILNFKPQRGSATFPQRSRIRCGRVCTPKLSGGQVSGWGRHSCLPDDYCLSPCSAFV